MSRRLRSANVLLERINDIDAECTEDDQEILDMENDNTENYDPFETDSNTDENEENISNVRRRRKRRRFLVSSDSENEEEASEIAMDGTVWQEVKIGSIILEEHLVIIFLGKHQARLGTVNVIL